MMILMLYSFLKAPSALVLLKMHITSPTSAGF